MGLISWVGDLFTTHEAPSPSTLDWGQKVVILSPAPNSYKEWILIEDLYQAFRERMKEE